MQRPDTINLLIPDLPSAEGNEQHIVREMTYVRFGNENGSHSMDCPGENLAQQLATGSEEAFTVIYNEHIYSLLDFSRELLDSRQDAEDVCAEVFTNLWTLRARFHNIQNIKAFLFISVRNACLNFLRSKQIKIKRETEQIDQLDQIIQPEDITPDVKSEYKERLRQMIDRLPEQCQRVFKLSCYQGLKNKEIATQLHISEKTVKQHKLRAKQLMRMSQKMLVLATLIFCFLSR